MLILPFTEARRTHLLPARYYGTYMESDEGVLQVQIVVMVQIQRHDGVLPLPCLFLTLPTSSLFHPPGGSTRDHRDTIALRTGGPLPTFPIGKPPEGWGPELSAQVLRSQDLVSDLPPSAPANSFLPSFMPCCAKMIHTVTRVEII